MLTINEIYNWVKKQYPYFKTTVGCLLKWQHDIQQSVNDDVDPQCVAPSARVDK
jgi:hypothetical protein